MTMTSVDTTVVAQFLSKRKFRLGCKTETRASLTTGSHGLGERHLHQVDRCVHITVDVETLPVDSFLGSGHEQKSNDCQHWCQDPTSSVFGEQRSSREYQWRT